MLKKKIRTAVTGEWDFWNLETCTYYSCTHGMLEEEDKSSRNREIGVSGILETCTCYFPPSWMLEEEDTAETGENVGFLGISRKVHLLLPPCTFMDARRRR
ncbi:hypothetical protein AVEN_212533-1 [Araneus ventricosus]|uniref:Uncharacterized protein n=1 Tax=Araneus ventricosus TaxID=182803 RepID=A0A4Y2SYK5_ARAVE|nr:hypothetical protein AVEN_212531-1 [Araneus ventricosus]GBN93412.1 hypothetical protein AVEN_212533-1 [Araneus ventricosus]